MLHRHPDFTLTLTTTCAVLVRRDCAPSGSTDSPLAGGTPCPAAPQGSHVRLFDAPSQPTGHHPSARPLEQLAPPHSPLGTAEQPRDGPARSPVPTFLSSPAQCSLGATLTLSLPAGPKQLWGSPPCCGKPRRPDVSAGRQTLLQ